MKSSRVILLLFLLVLSSPSWVLAARNLPAVDPSCTHDPPTPPPSQAPQEPHLIEPPSPSSAPQAPPPVTSEPPSPSQSPPPDTSEPPSPSQSPQPHLEPHPIDPPSPSQAPQSPPHNSEPPSPSQAPLAPELPKHDSPSPSPAPHFPQHPDQPPSSSPPPSPSPPPSHESGITPLSKCWKPLLDVTGCVDDLKMAYHGFKLDVGPMCCHAINKTTDECLFEMLCYRTRNVFFPLWLREHCAHV